MVTCRGPRSGRRSSRRNRFSDHRVGPPFVRSLDIARPAPGNTRVIVSPVSALPAVALSPRPKPNPPMPCTLPVPPPVLFGAMTSWLHHPGQAQGPHGEVIGSSWEESAPTLGAPRNQGCPSASSSHRSAKHREEGASRWGRWEAAEGRRGVMGYWGPDGHWSLSPCPCSSAQARAVSASTGAWKTCGLLENHGRSQAHHQALYFSLWQGGAIPPRTFCCPCLPLRPLQPTVALYSIGSIPEECHY